MAREINHNKHRYPFCIVWSPIPLITWIFPFIGHTGICDSQGVIHDFAGPYTITVDQFAFGVPTRYLVLSPELCVDQEWDGAVESGCNVYKGRMHNLFCDNCHSHVAECLNKMRYGENFNQLTTTTTTIRRTCFKNCLGDTWFVM